MLKNYFKIALRNLRSRKAYTFINLSGLAVGMACALLIGLWVQDEMSFEDFQANRNELYAVSMRDSRDRDTRESTSFVIPYALVPLMKEEFPQIIEFTRIQQRSRFESCMLKYGDKAFYDDGILLVDPAFFQMFTYRFVEGSPQAALADKNSIVITRKTAAKFFGNEDPIGKILRFNNREDLMVSAVVKDPPHNSEIQFDAVAPIQILGAEKLNKWWWESSSYILVRNNTDVAKLGQGIAGMIQKHHPTPGMDVTVGIQPLARIHLHYGDGDIRLVYVFVSVAVFMLLIACINYMNLSTARFSKRAREVGLRKVLGAQRGSLLRQFLFESASLSIAALIISLVLVELVLPVFNSVTDKNLSLISSGSLQMICGLVALALLVGVTAGSYPAIFLSSFQPAAVIRGITRTNSRSPLLRTILVVTQFSVAIILIISTIMVYRQYEYLIHKDLGYNKDQIVYFRFNKEIEQKYESVKNALLQDASIKNVTLASSLPNEVGNVNPISDWPGKQGDGAVFVRFAVTDRDYLNTFRMKLSAGRNFSKDVAADTSNFVVNNKAAALMHLKDPVDTRISFMGLSGKVIGVVDDFNNRPLEEETSPLILTINPKFYGYFVKYVLVKINSNDVPATVGYLESRIREFAPGYPFEFTFLDQTINTLYSSVERTWHLFESFAFLAIFISCLGLFGLASFMTELRTKEIGVRKTLGASAQGILMLLSREFARWVLLANLVAWPVAYLAMNKWLQGFAYKTDLNPWIFVVSGLVALAIAMLTVGFHTVKAATANPVEALRYE